MAPSQVVVPCYAAQPIVYVVQVPGAGPTPPASECSSDVENVQLCTVERLAQPMELEQKDDIIILPLSPDPVLEQSVVSESSAGEVETVVTSTNLSLPDRRKKKNRREKSSNNNNNDNSSEDMDCDVDVVQVTPVAKTVSVFYQIVLKFIGIYVQPKSEAQSFLNLSSQTCILPKSHSHT